MKKQKPNQESDLEIYHRFIGIHSDIFELLDQFEYIEHHNDDVIESIKASRQYLEQALYQFRKGIVRD